MGQFGRDRRRRPKRDEDDDERPPPPPRASLATVKSWHYPRNFGMSKATFQVSVLYSQLGKNRLKHARGSFVVAAFASSSFLHIHIVLEARLGKHRFCLWDTTGIDTITSHPSFIIDMSFNQVTKEAPDI